ncbi:hypothetical protein [Phascolarctobacterium succinatutens]|uniref:hypothetical protein n=1 Tax=Phascolarctobacterium succinatutens TaxID=626940 RepID=UPI0026EBE27D|nr:hypothetical protein [Phascolarctobacterium succinatutens]
MVERLKQFLVDEFNLTFEEACKMSLEEKKALFDKCVEIELDEAYKSDPISERGLLAATWVTIITQKEDEMKE